MSDIPSAACDRVMGLDHPAWEHGGPCAGCAFRKGTEAANSAHTVELARLCVEGDRYFHCHEHPSLCRGFMAAINLRGVHETESAKRMAEVYGFAADVLQDGIDAGVQAQEAKSPFRR